MGMNWITIAEQLRAIGVTVPGTIVVPGDINQPIERLSAKCPDRDEEFTTGPSAADHCNAVVAVLKAPRLLASHFLSGYLMAS